MKKELRIFDKPQTVKKLLLVFYVFLLGLLMVDFFIHKHGDFPWEEVPGFFAVYGFLSCVAFIFIAKGIRMIVKREEDYYE